jgi:hypothetical protein
MFGAPEFARLSPRAEARRIAPLSTRHAVEWVRLLESRIMV